MKNKLTFLRWSTLLCVFSVLVLAACNDDEDQSMCPEKVIVDQEEYMNTPSGFASVTDVSISGDCLTINFGASGCNADNWIVKLVADERTTRPVPPQRNAKLTMDSLEFCLAFFTMEVTYDISELRESVGNEVILNLEGWDTPISYTY